MNSPWFKLLSTPVSVCLSVSLPPPPLSPSLSPASLPFPLPCPFVFQGEIETKCKMKQSPFLPERRCRFHSSPRAILTAVCVLFLRSALQVSCVCLFLEVSTAGQLCVSCSSGQHCRSAVCVLFFRSALQVMPHATTHPGLSVDVKKLCTHVRRKMISDCLFFF